MEMGNFFNGVDLGGGLRGYEKRCVCVCVMG